MQRSQLEIDLSRGSRQNHTRLIGERVKVRIVRTQLSQFREQQRNLRADPTHFSKFWKPGYKAIYLKMVQSLMGKGSKNVA